MRRVKSPSHLLKFELICSKEHFTWTKQDMLDPIFIPHQNAKKKKKRKENAQGETSPQQKSTQWKLFL